jgi:hypothetical protein
VGVVARKVELFWNCYESIGTAEAAACVGVSGWYQRCRVGVGGAAAGGLHHERISAVLREGCVSKAEQARLRQAREQSRASRDSALARGEAPGSCMQAAMDALCDAQFAAGAVARRDFSQYLCCVRTVGAAAAGEQSLGCVDENGFFTDCAPCDRSAGFRDFSDQLRAVQRHGCQRADTSASGGGREGGGRGMGLARETAAASAHEAAHSTDGFGARARTRCVRARVCARDRPLGGLTDTPAHPRPLRAARVPSATSCGIGAVRTRPACARDASDATSCAPTARLPPGSIRTAAATQPGSSHAPGLVGEGGAVTIRYSIRYSKYDVF